MPKSSLNIDKKNKLAIVTRGASALGPSITKGLAENDIRTIMIGRNERNIKEVFKPRSNVQAAV